MAGRQADDRRFDVEATRQVAVGQVLAAGEDSSIVPRLGHGLLMSCDRL